MDEKFGNQWAYLTQYSVNTDIISLSRFGDTLITFEGMAPATPQILKHMRRWLQQGKPLPIYQEEWLCLYCGSPNPLPDRHCSQCGAPRNWLL